VLSTNKQRLRAVFDSLDERERQSDARLSKEERQNMYQR